MRESTTQLTYNYRTTKIPLSTTCISNTNKPNNGLL